jgi:hypothetical protein
LRSNRRRVRSRLRRAPSKVVVVNHVIACENSLAWHTEAVEVHNLWGTRHQASTTHPYDASLEAAPKADPLLGLGMSVRHQDNCGTVSEAPFKYGKASLVRPSWDGDDARLNLVQCLVHRPAKATMMILRTTMQKGHTLVLCGLEGNLPVLVSFDRRHFEPKDLPKRSRCP